MISILYVDDEPDLLRLCKIFLERTGEFCVDTTESVHNAWDKLKGGSYDAIISDYLMPETDGIEFLEQVRSSLGDIPFILFTGKGREEVVVRAIDRGVDFYQQKGGDPRAQFAELSHKVRKAVERSRAVSALAKSEERMRLAIEGAHEGLWDINVATGEVYLSPRGCQMLGYSPDEMQNFSGDRWKNLVHPDDLVKTFTRLDPCRQGEEEFFESEERILTRSGEWKWVLSRGKVYARDEKGRAIRFVGTHTDITELKRVQEELLAAYEQIAASDEELRVQLNELITLKDALQISETKFRTIVETSPDIIWEIRPEGTITYISPLSFDLIGYSPEEMTGRSLLSYLHPKGKEVMKRHLKDAAEGRETGVRTFEIPVIHRDGRVLILIIRSNPLVDARENLTGFRGTASYLKDNPSPQ